MAFVVLAVLISIFGGGATALVVINRLDADPKGAVDEIETRKRECDRMWKSANDEEAIYGLIVSGSIANHINSCNYCQYVRGGDRKLLTAHRAETRKIIEDWKHGRRGASNTD